MASKNRKRNTNRVIGILAILFALVGSLVVLSYLQKGNDIGRSGAASRVKLYFQPSSAVLPPSRKVKLILDSQSTPIVFASVTIQFDPNLLELGAEIDTTTGLPTVIQKTSRSEGSQKGIATFTIAATPGKPLPKGVFELGTISFTKRSSVTTPNVQTSVSISSAEIVSSTNESLITDLSPLLLALNSQSLPSATAVATVKPSSTPVATTAPTPATLRKVKIVNVPLSASANGFGLDAIIENGVTKEGENLSAFAYSSGWIYDYNNLYKGGRARWTRTQDASVTFNTTASSIEVFTKFEPTVGSFDVYVNDKNKRNYKVNATSTKFGSITVPLPL